MIPRELKEDHILQAIERIDDTGVPPRRKSRRYDLVFEGKRYPPKYVISLAIGFTPGVEHPPRFNAVEAKDYLLGHNYEVSDRSAKSALSIAPEDDESAFPEGTARYAFHRKLERDAKIVRKAKENRFSETGNLKCDVCSLDFKKTYGSRGEGFIEAHHKAAVATLGGTVKTKLSDLALVCSNCHRMLHRGSPMLSVDELRRIVHDRQSKTRFTS